MKKLMARGLLAATLVLAGAGPALAAPADQGNCVSARDNGGAAGERVSGAAGPGFGPAVAAYLGVGTIGATASAEDCRR